MQVGNLYWQSAEEFFNESYPRLFDGSGCEGCVHQFNGAEAYIINNAATVSVYSSVWTFLPINILHQ
jgi:hypothetical protein